jgi:carboxyl-terminal processing protease
MNPTSPGRSTLHALLTGLLLTISVCATGQERPYLKLFDALWNTVNDNYYDPHFRGTDWAAVRGRYQERMAAVRTDDEFRQLAASMLAEIPSSHLHVSPPRRSQHRFSIGAGFRTLEDHVVVTEVAHLSDAYRQGLRPGAILLSDQESIRGEIGADATVRIQDCKGVRRSLTVRREAAFWPPEHPGFRWSQIRIGTDRTIGYFRIDRFDDGAAELADRAMEELGDVNAIIIDIRANSGGNASALRLNSYFAPGVELAFVLLSRPYLQALGHPVTAADVASAPRVNRAYTTEAIFAALEKHGGGASFWTEEVEKRFEGPVFLLIGPDTGSAAEGFAWYMQLRTKAQLIGEQTAGALLSSDTFELPDGWRVTIPVHGIWGPDGTDFADRALTPDVQVATTRADLCTGRDKVVETAMRLVGK